MTFYSLPELSPVFNTAQVPGCYWIGGLDLNRPHDRGQDGPEAFDIVLLSLRRKLRVIRIGEEQPRSIKVGKILYEVLAGSCANYFRQSILRGVQQ